ncbi:Uncharacterised protein [Mycobacteroides abscessus subsp. abscessus]|nr:Uncharacterised protein [Mycobacteroides abscessus subsp. abscessus]
MPGAAPGVLDGYLRRWIGHGIDEFEEFDAHAVRRL